MRIKRIGQTLAALAAAVMMTTACADELPTMPGGTMGSPGAPSIPHGGVVVVGDGQWETAKAPELGSCANIAAPAGTTLAARAYAKGFQVYRWDGNAWAFVAPDAELFADAGFHGKLGTHYAGPTWESNSGSTVKAALAAPCPVGGGNIPWLLLDATANAGHGPFANVTHIQRVNTVGGVAPAEPGTAIGEVKNVPYTATYYFYRAG